MQRVHGICIFYSLFFVRGTAQCSSSATCRSRGTMKIFTQIFGDREDYIQETLEPDILSKVSEFISSKQLRCGVLLSIRTQLQIKNYWGPWISILFADVAVYTDVAHIDFLAYNQLSLSTHRASQSSLDTHNQAYGLKCNRKSRVLRASKCRTTHNATATRESRGTDDPLKSSKLNFQNGEVKFHQQWTSIIEVNIPLSFINISPTRRNIDVPG